MLRWSFRAGVVALVAATLWKLFASGDLLLIAHGVMLVLLGCLVAAGWLAWKFSGFVRKAVENGAERVRAQPPPASAATLGNGSRPETVH